jgi:imidazolonepropionase-like amidohydrolase
MNNTADAVVAFESSVADPRGPNAVWEPIPPNAPARSAAFPLCNSTTTIRNKQITTCTIVNNVNSILTLQYRRLDMRRSNAARGRIAVIKSPQAMNIRRNLILLLSLCLSAAWADTTVLQNFTLIDGANPQPLANAAMVIVDGRIRWVGPAANLKPRPGAKVIKLDGKYVMPGIINVHGHLGNTVELAQDSKNFTRENVESNLRVYTSYGVTAMCSLGSEQRLILDMRAEQRRTNRPSMTRIFTALRGFTGVGGYPTTAPGMKGVPFEVATPADVKADVSELAGNKVDIVKIWVDDHLGKDKKISMDLCKDIIEDAHRYHLKVAAHVFYLDDAKTLINNGLYGLAHSVRDKPVDDELIQAMKQHHAWQAAATLTREASTFAYAKPSPMLNDPFFAPSVSANVLRTLRDPKFQSEVAAEPDAVHGRAWFEMAKKNLKTLVDAGVQCAFGTDSGPPRRFQGFSEHWEMELMAEAGLTPQQIITMATKNSAEFLGAKDLGSLQKGKWADLIVLTRNPLDDIKNTRTIEQVWIAGNKVR